MNTASSENGRKARWICNISQNENGQMVSSMFPGWTMWFPQFARAYDNVYLLSGLYSNFGSDVTHRLSRDPREFILPKVIIVYILIIIFFINIPVIILRAEH